MKCPKCQSVRSVGMITAKHLAHAQAEASEADRWVMWLDFSGRNPHKMPKSKHPGRTFHVHRRTFSRTGRIKNQKLYERYFVNPFRSGKIGSYLGVQLIEDSRDGLHLMKEPRCVKASTTNR